MSALNPNYCENFVSAVGKEWINENYCDVTLVAEDGTHIKAHRLILAATNDFFKAMFSSTSFKEASLNEITIGEITGLELKTFIEYSYTGIIHNVDENNAQTILLKAMRFLYKDVVKHCEEILISNLSLDNCFEQSSFAEYYNCECLLKAAKSYQRKHLSQVILREEYLQLSAEDVLQLLHNNQTENADVQKQIFHALMKWIDECGDQRQEFLSKLLKTVRLDLFEDDFLRNDVLNKVGSNLNCKEQVLSAIKYKVLKNKTKLVIVQRDKISIYNIFTKEIEDFFYTGKYIHHETYLLGDRLICNDWSINLKTGDFDLNACEYREDHSIAVLNGVIYAFGRGEQSIQRFDANEKRWTSIANMPQEKRKHASAVLNGKLFVVGGDDKSTKTTTNTMQCFDPITNSWCFCAPMLQSREDFAIVATSNSLYVFGGLTTDLRRSKIIEKYDPVTDTWNKVAELIDEYNHLAACLVEDKIIVIAGKRYQSHLDMLEFDLITNKCKYVRNLPIAYHFNWELRAHSYK